MDLSCRTDNYEKSGFLQYIYKELNFTIAALVRMEYSQVLKQREQLKPKMIDNDLQSRMLNKTHHGENTND